MDLFFTSTVGVRSLPDRAVLRVVGPDARSWLQGQVTNDVVGVGPDEAVYALVVNVRGKILADVHVVAGPDDLRVTIPRDRAEALIEHLEAYLVMEDVDLELTDEAVLTAQGPRARDAVERAGLLGRAYRADRLGIPGLDVRLPAAEAEAARARLEDAARALGGGPVDDGAWADAHLRRGRPRFAVDFGERSYPQEAGLRDLAVSFSKGCYLGQEVVCTLENRGQLVRRLMIVEGPGPIPAGTELTADGKAVGRVTGDGRPLEPTDRTRAFAYVKRARAEAGATVEAGERTLRVVGPAGAPLD
ncbi:MAG: YgfZ/GcvT domain-containing protein [Sandaracinaceae bacterium]